MMTPDEKKEIIEAMVDSLIRFWSKIAIGGFVLVLSVVVWFVIKSDTYDNSVDLTRTEHSEIFEHLLDLEKQIAELKGIISITHNED